MVTYSVFISTLVATSVTTVGSLTIVAKVLGNRITEVGSMLSARMGGLETRMNALEGAVRDVGERVTALETDLDNRR